MDWQKCMNKALDYIENNLASDIDYYAAAKIMNCSEWEFRRIFSFLAQIPLSEYIRRRRLTMAAVDIKNGKKIIDVAMRYGYESQTAFSRAFSRFHGIAPSLARDEKVALKTFPRLTFKLILMDGNSMKRNPNHRTNIIGAGEVGYGISIDMDKNNINKMNSSFWGTKGNEVIGSTVLPNYGAFVSEEKCNLFGDVSEKKLLEICCGNGHSLKYHADHKASELWGIDISEKQLEKARKYLSLNGIPAKLICSPMEEECGIPVDYFDYVYSVYGVGWATDLEGAFFRIASYLKKDGVFIFSWSHPIHKCVVSENDLLTFKKNYFDESWYSVALEGGAICLSDRKLSTYINALAKAGFIIEEMIEDPDEDMLKAHKDGDFVRKAKMLPLIFVIKARKL